MEMMKIPNEKQFDVNPQFFRMPYLIESAPHSYTEVNKTTPVVSNIGANKSMVMEILKIFMHIVPAALEDAEETSSRVHIADRTNNNVIDFSKAGCILYAKEQCMVLDTATTDGTVAVAFPSPTKVYDYTDGNGNGVIFGGPTLFMGIAGGGTNAGTGVVTAAILFRMKKVSAGEYAQSLQFP